MTINVAEILPEERHLVQAGIEANYGVQAATMETFPVISPQSEEVIEFKPSEETTFLDGELSSTATSVKHTHNFGMYLTPQGALTEPSTSVWLQGSRMLKSTTKILRVTGVTGTFTPGEMLEKQGTPNTDIGNIIAWLPDLGDVTQGYIFLASAGAVVATDVVETTVTAGEGTVSSVINGMLFAYNNDQSTQASLSIKHNMSGHEYYSLGVRMKFNGEMTANEVPKITFTGAGLATSVTDQPFVDAPLVCSTKPKFDGARTVFLGTELTNLVAFNGMTYEVTGDAVAIPDAHTPLTGVAGYINQKAAFTLQMTFSKMALSTIDPLALARASTRGEVQVHHLIGESATNRISLFFPQTHYSAQAGSTNVANVPFWQISLAAGPHCSGVLKQMYMLFW